MKNGFDLILYFLLLPLTVAFEILWLWLDEKTFKKILYYYWMPACGLVFLALLFRYSAKETKVETASTDPIREALNGSYVVDRTRFAGPKADWQYNHYRFVITPDDSLILYITEHERVLKKIKGTITYRLAKNNNPRITLNFPPPLHHLLRKKPILIQDGTSYYYVFYSKKYGNIFFTKGEWEAIDKVAKE